MKREAGTLAEHPLDQANIKTAAEIRIMALRQRILQNPGNPGPRNRLAALLQADGRADEAVLVLRETISQFPRNAPAQEQLTALVEQPFQRPPAVLAPLQQSSVMPSFELFQPVAAPPAASGWSLVQEPRGLPIRLGRWRPSAELIGGVSIILVLGAIWEAWRLLPQSHLLQRPAVIVTQAAIPRAASIVIDSVAVPAPAFVRAEPADPLTYQDARPREGGPAPTREAVASLAPPLPQTMPPIVMILYERTGAEPQRAASRLAARLQAEKLPIGAPMPVAGAGQPGIGYFYVEDRAEAEALQRRLPDFDAGVRLISGAARAAQQPGAVAIVIR